MKHSSKTFGLLMALFVPAAVMASPDSLCRSDEAIRFNCLTGKKTASLCAAPATGEPATLTYRYGTAEKVELEYRATADNKHAFFAFTHQIDPRARINQVWFDRGDVRYLMTECAGGNCSVDGRLAVLRGAKTLMNAECRNPSTSPSAFSRELIQFGSGPDSARSASPLLKWEEAANPVEELYQSEAAKPAR